MHFRFFIFLVKLLNTFYKPTVTNKTVQKTKQKRHTIKLVNKRHSAHHSQALIMETVTVIKKIIG